ncbi:hypothetical protein SHKM778_94630 (plasmid) [Streptomyces sp. KM77-8]|uniref:Uncharacterized protein n=1 Tax=Streptomyces haneummycinicus TaxID=3074435 RepID=A0AAT9I0I1_9ACTN
MAGTGNKRMLTNRESSYDPASGENWRITVNLPPVVAEALIPKLREIHPAWPPPDSSAPSWSTWCCVATCRWTGSARPRW